MSSASQRQRLEVIRHRQEVVCLSAPEGFHEEFQTGASRAEIIGRRYSFFDDEVVELNIRAAKSGRKMFHGLDPLTRR